jgi:hypothetical protein
MKWMTSIDLLGREYLLNTSKNGRHQTIFGGCVFLFVAISSLSICSYFISLLISRSVMTLLINPIKLKNPLVDMTSKPFIFTLIDNKNIPIPQESLWNLYLILLEYAVNNQTSLDGQITYTTSYKKIELEKCDLNIHFDEYRSYFTSYPSLKNSYCIKPEFRNITLHGSYGSASGWNTLIAYINTCSNKTETCFDQDTINKKLVNTYFQIGSIDYELDHSNFEKPVTLYSKKDAYPVSSSLYGKFFLYYKNTKYLSDEGYLLQDFKKIDMVQYSNYKVNYFSPAFGLSTLSNSTNIGQFTIFADDITDQYTRSYMTAQTLIANIGGVIKSIFLLGKVFVYIFTDKIFYLEIFNSINNLSVYYDTEFRRKSINKIRTKVNPAVINNYVSENNETLTKNSNIKFNKNNREEVKKIVSSSVINNLILDNNETLTKNFNLNAYKIKRREVGNKPRSLNLKEIVFPCYSREITKFTIDHFERILSEKVSVKNILVTSNSLYNLKKILFNPQQLSLFNSIENFILKDLEKTKANSNFQALDDQPDEFFQKLNENSLGYKKKINQSLVEYYSHYYLE